MTGRDVEGANRRLARRLAAGAVLMFGFGFALSPLYHVLCRATGINGATGDLDPKAAAAMRPDLRRTVTVEFTGNAITGLPWSFYPLRHRLVVHPGQPAQVRYYVRNRARETITGRAVATVTPAASAPYFKKIECFCFHRETLAPGEERVMPVRFVIEPQIDRAVNTITLSYAFFNVNKVSAAAWARRAPANRGEYAGPAPGV